ncbi:hypothetical protein BV25DRAFT_1126174 [Artomyces pyxidatus]|uniref:Uncharacterized protein n=1 Tax=Artomyces pyxidatus TaxID=48021 RepID=A0ACB8SU46_9AGAM|nr:hypothetical protein BV25DRAFT_1126174 [Artomyces pyxidatus]
MKETRGKVIRIPARCWAWGGRARSSSLTATNTAAHCPSLVSADRWEYLTWLWVQSIRCVIAGSSVSLGAPNLSSYRSSVQNLLQQACCGLQERITMRFGLEIGCSALSYRHCASRGTFSKSWPHVAFHIPIQDALLRAIYTKTRPGLARVRAIGDMPRRSLVQTHPPSFIYWTVLLCTY